MSIRDVPWRYILARYTAMHDFTTAAQPSGSKLPRHRGVGGSWIVPTLRVGVQPGTSPSEGPNAGASVFLLIFFGPAFRALVKKVSRRKGETASSHTRSKGHALT